MMDYEALCNIRVVPCTSRFESRAHLADWCHVDQRSFAPSRVCLKRRHQCCWRLPTARWKPSRVHFNQCHDLFLTQSTKCLTISCSPQLMSRCNGSYFLLFLRACMSICQIVCNITCCCLLQSQHIRPHPRLHVGNHGCQRCIVICFTRLLTASRIDGCLNSVHRIFDL